RVKADLRAMIERIPRDAYSVRQVLPQIEQVWDDLFWQFLTVARIDLLRLKVGPLLRYAADVDVANETFTHKVERLRIGVLGGRDTTDLVQSIAEDASRLPDFVREVAERAAAISFCLSPALTSATPAQLDQIIDVLAGQMRYRKAADSAFLVLDLPDYIATRGYILLFGGVQEMYVETYRQMVEERVLDVVANHPTVRAIEKGQAVSDQQLLALERTLREELGAPGIELTEDNIRKAFARRVGSLMEFVREMLELDGIPDYQEIVRRQFDAYMGGHAEYSADQLRFLRAVQNVFLQKRRLTLPDLYSPPLTAFGADAASRWFTDQQLDDVLSFFDTLTVTGASLAH
ncbi:MAG TPA: type I restriction-modification enzyme R subunit C-terminal domain-containing protein, partial [Anaerolineae bacterium]|nr:type I restriction-modification enzyme R subunit C-terminal domain-containing protein [Anaerolineae bacterium]